MTALLQVLTLTLALLAAVPALAHALELPGKLRLSREGYATVQGIYYPGFTMMVGAEPLSVVVSGLLLAVTPLGSASFWLTLAGLLGLATMHITYWLVTHPVNRIWVRKLEMSSGGRAFFYAGGAEAFAEAAEPESDWIRLRDRWEHSHVIRAGLALPSFVSLATAAVLR